MYQTQTQRSEIKDARHTATLPDRSGMVEKGVAFHEEPSRSMLRSAPIGTSSGGRERVCCWPVGMVGNTTLSPHKIVLAPELLNHSDGVGFIPTHLPPKNTLQGGTMGDEPTQSHGTSEVDVAPALSVQSCVHKAYTQVLMFILMCVLCWKRVSQAWLS